ncbi:hypothetical protein AB0J83_10925 [Actinoplanes sp. NPDC049596]|uniref:hypothetical protein n=1 Tax=unclassified Actinoplanes TaxID=2626549 RepID=UPI00344513EE
MLIVVAGVEGARWWSGRPPYSPEELAATAELRLVDPTTARTALGPNMVPELAKDQQIFLGKVSWHQPAHPEGALYVMLFHHRTHRPPAMLVPQATPGDEAGVGSNGALWDAAERYPWLAGAAGVYEPGFGYTSTDALAVYKLGREELSFAAVLLPADVDFGSRVPRATTPAVATDLTVALVQVNENGRATWARRLLN